jgi:hypothetical protein
MLVIDAALKDPVTFRSPDLGKRLTDTFIRGATDAKNRMLQAAQDRTHRARKLYLRP